MYAQYSEDIRLELISHLFYLPFVMAATYFTLYVLIPKFLIRKKIFLFIVLFLVSAPVFTALSRFNTMFFLIPWQYPDAVDTYTVFSSRFLASIPSLYFTVLAAAAIKLFFYFYKNEVERNELAKEKLDAEMKFLKAQIHPHFLFNTLNNLYVLAKKKSDQTADVVMQLSDILRYILYDCSREVVPLAKELEVVKNYIALEKIRYRENLRIIFNITGEPNGVMVPPLILLPLVENAFKHGVSTDISNPFITLTLKIEANKIEFLVFNSKSETDVTSRSGHDNGIGLVNLKNRLELGFRNKYRLEIFEGKQDFSTSLNFFGLENGKV